MKAFSHPLLLATFCCLLTLSTQAAEKDQTVPADVGALTDRAAACRHWSGVEITDQSDDALVEEELTSLKCDSLAADVVKLQSKYADSEPALKAISALHALGF